MERWLVKVISLLIVFFVTLTATLLPIKLNGIFKQWGEKGTKLLDYMMCYGGGVFFAIYMLHMAPDAKELVDHMIVQPYNISYPIGELLISIGFFMMVFSEKLVENIQKRMKHKDVPEVEEPFNQNDTIGRKLSLSQHDSMLSNYPNLSIDIGMDAADSRQQTNNINNKQAMKYQTVAKDEEASGAHIGHEIDVHGTRSLILLLALSLHHVFEGISVGLKKTETAVWNLTIAIVCHEIVIAFSLGLQLVRSYKKIRQVVIAGVLCTSMIPIGIAIGLLLIETKHGDSPSVNMINGILQSIATGVFIYITFFEILAEQISHNNANMKKLFAILFGFTTMALLALVPEETNEWPVENNNGTGLH